MNLAGASVTHGDLPDAGTYLVFSAGTAVPFSNKYNCTTHKGWADYADYYPTSGVFYVHKNEQVTSPTIFFSGWGDNWAVGNPPQNGFGYEIWTGDFTGDGYADYAVHDMANGTFYIHKNNINGTFDDLNSWVIGSNHVNGVTGDYLWDLGSGRAGDPGWEWLVGDFNNDCYADYLEHYRPDGTFFVHENYKDGGFAPWGTNIASGQTKIGAGWSMAVGDFNGDGYADYADVHIGDATAQVYVHLNNHTGGFHATVDFQGPGPTTPFTEVVVGDFNGDGCADYAFNYPLNITGRTEQMGPAYLNNCNGTGFTLGNLDGGPASGSGNEILGIPHRTLQSRLPVSGGTTQYNNGINYYGGYVVSGTKSIYVIWYGHWPTPNNAQMTTIDQFIDNMTGAKFLDVESGYMDNRGDYVNNSYRRAGDYLVDGGDWPGSTGFTQYPDAGFPWQATLVDLINNGTVPFDPVGVYAIFTSPDIQHSWVCNGGGGFHYGLNVPGKGFVEYLLLSDSYGNPRCYLGGNSYQYCNPSPYAPNQICYPDGGCDTGIDVAIDVFVHELVEAESDPGINTGNPNWGNIYPNTAWASDNPAHLYENADLCQQNYPNWTHVGTITNNGTSEYYNVTLAGRYYYFQPNWLNADGGYCAMCPTWSDPTCSGGGATGP
jgi:hypothetical protein